MTYLATARAKLDTFETLDDRSASHGQGKDGRARRHCDDRPAARIARLPEHSRHLKAWARPLRVTQLVDASRARTSKTYQM
jgi:hypothetical protein